MNFLDVYFDKNTFTIFLKCKQKNELQAKIVVSDIDIDCVYYTCDTLITAEFDAWIVPFNEKIKNFLIKSKTFPGLLVKLYNNQGRLLQVEKIYINKSPLITERNYVTPEFDITGPSYADFFYGDLCKGIDTSGVVVDAGANVGFFTLYSKYNGAKRIYSIEPDPLPYFYLEKNFKNDKEVILLNKALSDVEDFISFDMSLGGSVASTMSKYSVYDYKETSLVQSITVNTILRLEEKINLLKLDIEGAEFDVLKYMSKYEFNRIDQMFIEFHADPKIIESTLLENNYSVEYRDSDRDSFVGFIYAKKI